MDPVYFAPGSHNAAIIDRAVTDAATSHRSLRFATGEDRNGRWLKVKIGEGMWSHALYEDQDPNRG